MKHVLEEKKYVSGFEGSKARKVLPLCSYNSKRRDGFMAEDGRCFFLQNGWKISIVKPENA